MSENIMVASPRDWPEDFKLENGKYQCGCTNCGNHFIGHKRRVTCKVCATPTPPDDVAGQIKELRELLGNLPLDDYKAGIAIVESLSRERAVLVELLRQCAIDRHVSFCQSTRSFEKCSLRLCSKVRTILDGARADWRRREGEKGEMAVTDNSKVHCDDCEWKGKQSQLKPINSGGHAVFVCPQCKGDTLSYPNDDDLKP